MWILIKSILLKWAALKALLRVLGSLGWLLPIALLLKAVGIPALIVLAVLGIPLLIVLAMIGLPILLVVTLGGALLAFTFWLLSMGLFALKLALPILAVVWLLRWWSRRDERGTGEEPPASG